MASIRISVSNSLNVSKTKVNQALQDICQTVASHSSSQPICTLSRMDIFTVQGSNDSNSALVDIQGIHLSKPADLESNMLAQDMSLILSTNLGIPANQIYFNAYFNGVQQISTFQAPSLKKDTPKKIALAAKKTESPKIEEKKEVIPTSPKKTGKRKSLPKEDSPIPNKKVKKNEEPPKSPSPRKSPKNTKKTETASIESSPKSTPKAKKEQLESKKASPVTSKGKGTKSPKASVAKKEIVEEVKGVKRKGPAAAKKIHKEEDTRRSSKRARTPKTLGEEYDYQ